MIYDDYIVSISGMQVLYKILKVNVIQNILREQRRKQYHYFKRCKKTLQRQIFVHDKNIYHSSKRTFSVW